MIGNKIAIEEHFAAPWLTPTSEEISFFIPEVFQQIEDRLPDLGAARLADMDRAGIAVAVLSQTAPGVQAVRDAGEATMLASRTNDLLHQQIQLHPDRFRGFACLALQDIDAACVELRRCIEELGFVGALVNGTTVGRYLDEAQFCPIWTTLEALEVPLYLHPGLLPAPMPSLAEHPELDGPVWAWTAETASHALRLVFGGVFDRHPKARIILGHMGETLPYLLWRLDSRAASSIAGRRMSRPPSQIIREHIVVTTSGVCDDAPLLCALEAMGEASVLFSTDYPYEDVALAGRWIETAAITEDQRQRICRGNAERLLRLESAPSPVDSS